MNPQTSKLRLMRWRLLGKELRQLFPIFAAAPVALIAFLFLVPTIGEFTNIRSGLPWELAFQLPGVVFSLGAVGLLVCQEKEQRSLQWLAALPIPPLEIVWGKLLAGIVGVALVWMTSLLASLLLQPLFPVQLDLAQWLLCLAINLYILVVGLAIGWRMESTLGAMFLLLLVAFVPPGVAQGISYVAFWETTQSDINSHVLVSICYLTLGIAAVYPLRRWGQRALTATRTKNVNSTQIRLPYRVTTSLPKRRHLMSPATGLIWQMARQNVWSLTVISLMFAISLGQLAIYRLEHSTQIAMIAALATSWLGVMTFGSEAFKHQVRFLADRGVSPAKVWWTRQLFSLSILSLFGLLGLAIAMRVLSGIEPHTFGPNSGELTFVHLLFLLLMTLVVLTSVYASSQWLGQHFQSAILNIAIVPPLAIGAVTFTISLLRWLGIDIMFVGLLAIFPMVGTWLSMRAWMDGRLGFRSAAVQLVVTTSIVGLVMGSLIAWPLLRPLNIDPTIAKEMQEFQESPTYKPTFGGGYQQTETMFGVPRRINLNEDTEQLPVDFRNRLLQEVSRIEHDLTLADNALESSVYTIDGMFLESLAELVPHWDMETTERATLFNRVVRAHFQLLRRIRCSCRIHEQDIADIAEIWLLRQLMLEDSCRLLEDQLYNEIVSYLADDLARQKARRVALVSTRTQLEQQRMSIWHSENPMRLESLSIPWDLHGTTAAARNRQQLQKAIQLIEDLWVLSAEPNQSQDEILRRVAQNRKTPAVNYGIGQMGRYFRVDDVADVTPNIRGIDYGWGLLGQQWRAGWETQAQRLPKRLPVSEASTLNLNVKGAKE